MTGEQSVLINETATQLLMAIRSQADHQGIAPDDLRTLAEAFATVVPYTR